MTISNNNKSNALCNNNNHGRIHPHQPKQLPVKKESRNPPSSSSCRQGGGKKNKTPRRFSVIAPHDRHALSFSVLIVPSCSSSSSHHHHHHQTPMIVEPTITAPRAVVVTPPAGRNRPVVDQSLTRLMSELCLPSRENSAETYQYCNTTTTAASNTTPSSSAVLISVVDPHPAVPTNRASFATTTTTAR
jgi:hypothetical protein